jgi:xanthine dehydrogenase iron-sulfur cluster and FAD-binding subunit A
LLIHAARLVVQSPEGSREIAIDEFHRGPGVSCLAGDEIISAIVLPDPPPRTGTSYLKLGRRGGSCDLAVVGVAAGITLAEGTVESARIALASVAPTPMRAHSAEAMLVGGVPDDTALESARRAAVGDISPISDVRASAEYRREAAAVVTVRALRSAVAALQPRGQLMRINLSVNGQRCEDEVEPNVTLVEWLRKRASHRHQRRLRCRASVVVSFRRRHAVNACLLLAVEASGHVVITIEGLPPGACCLRFKRRCGRGCRAVWLPHPPWRGGRVPAASESRPRARRDLRGPVGRALSVRFVPGTSFAAIGIAIEQRFSP